MNIFIVEDDEIQRKNLKSTMQQIEKGINIYEAEDKDEALEIANNNNKVVILNIYEEGKTNIVQVRNSRVAINSAKIESIFERGFSTKKGENRGYGFYNVKKIAEKNGDNVQLSFEGNYTVFKILFK